MLEILEVSIPFVLVLIFEFPFIKWLKNQGIGQHIRTEGPNMHNYKEGTPTMGGLIFIPVVVIVAMAFNKSPQIILLALSTFAFSIVGYFDGVVKVLRKTSEGLKPKQKLSFQFIIAIVVYTIVERMNPHTYAYIPFVGRWEMGWFYPVFALVFLVGMSNSSNLTDGLDGLAGGIYVIGAIGLVVFSILKQLPLAMTLTSIGAILAFLFYNLKPAKIFMGDVGSLALGGYIGALGVLYGYELWIVLLFPVFVIEALSDIIQVVSWKVMKRRVFLMAPIHHHYELKGKSETNVTISFWMFNAIFVIAAGGMILCISH